MRKVSYLSYNMTTADANNPDGIVPVGRQFDFIGDVETEEMILVDGDESLCLGYEDVKIYQDVYVGDMMEYKQLTVQDFVAKTGSSDPTPGGGSIAALTAATGAALVEMMANLTIGKKGYEEVLEEMHSLQQEAKALELRFLELLEKDTAAFG